MKPIGNDKHKIMATILFDEFNYTQVSISRLMNTSTSTMSSWIKYGRLLIQNGLLKKEVENMKNELYSLGYREIKPLDNNILNELNDNILDDNFIEQNK